MRSELRKRTSALAVSALVLGLLTGGVAGAQQTDPSQSEAEPESPPTTAPVAGPPDGLIEALYAALELEQVNARIAATTQEAAEARLRLVEANERLSSIVLQHGRVSGRLEVARKRLEQKAAAVYRMNGGEPPVLQVKRAQQLNAANQYAGASSADHARTVDRLTVFAADLARERQTLLIEVNQLSDDMTRLTQLDLQLRDEARNAQVDLERAGGVSIMGESRLTAQQMTAWFESTGQHANLPEGTSIGDLVQMYVDEGSAEHVRADLAFVQSILETGSFSETRGNNYSGIGNCDSCGGKGMFFPTPRDGVRAQIQLLRSYADVTSRASNLSHPLDPTLFQSARSYDSFFLKGKVPLWNQMGNGNWATSTTYAAKIMRIYANMLEFAGLL